MERFNGLILVGEKRSQKAIDKDWSWQRCQLEGPRLCAIKLFHALGKQGYPPEDQVFINVFHDDGRLNEPLVKMLQEIDARGYTIVGMGNIVQEVLEKFDVRHSQIVHPAARGNWKKPGVYEKHVQKVLSKL